MTGDETLAASTVSPVLSASDEGPEPGPFEGRFGRRFAIAFVAAVAVGIVMRFVVHSALWEDEALTAAISRRPLSELRTLLSHDGSPPLYYALLHFWMKIFGEGDAALRSLSGVIGVMALPAAWCVGRRIGGPDRGRSQWVAWSAVLIVASSPYAVRFSTELRMYQLETLLALLGYLAIANALEAPRLGRLASVAAATAALLYTHYWAQYIIVVTFVLLLVPAFGAKRDPAARRTLLAMITGGIAFLPWLPTMAYQAAHTGTPWTLPTAPASAIYQAINAFAGFQSGAVGFSGAQERLSFTGPRFTGAYILLFCLYILSLLALFGRSVDRFHIDIDLRTQPRARALWIFVGGTLLFGSTVSYFAESAFQFRYVAGVFGLFAALVALGIVTFANHNVRYVLLAIIVASGLVNSIDNMSRQRTQGFEVAHKLNKRAADGDVFVFCPDQIGVSVVRYMKVKGPQYSFPTFETPEIINWVDYAERNKTFRLPGVKGNLAEPKRFAAEVVRRAKGKRIWYVWTPGYLLGPKCGNVLTELGKLRPDHATVVQAKLLIFENENVERFDP